MKVTDAVWFTTADRKVIGIIMGVDARTGEHKAYLGYGVGDDEAIDAARILENGSKVHVAKLKEVIAFLESK